MAEVVIQPRAFADIRRVVGWIADRVSPASAARWQAALGRAIESLADNPERCPLADEAADLGVELRELLHGRGRQVYRVLFTIDKDVVNVHRVRHAAQDWIGEGDL